MPYLKLQFVPASLGIAAEAFDDDLIILNLDTGQYFNLSDGAALMWHGLTAGASLETLLSGLKDDPPASAEANACLGALVDQGLLRKTATLGLSTHPMAEQIAQRHAQTPLSFSFDAFDDLADMLLADPIHDVDKEAGWPHRDPELS